MSGEHPGTQAFYDGTRKHLSPDQHLALAETEQDPLFMASEEAERSLWAPLAEGVSQSDVAAARLPAQQRQQNQVMKDFFKHELPKSMVE